MSVGDSLKLLLLYRSDMGKPLVVEVRPKWRSNSSRTCLYSVCECGGVPKITIPVWASYEKVGENWVKLKMAIEFFPYTPIQRICV